MSNNNSSSSSSSNTTNTTPIVPDMTTGVLLKLKIKSLRRFMCVSKSWCRLISGPEFAKLYFDLAAAPTTRLLCMSRSSPDVLAIDVDESILLHHILQLPLRLDPRNAHLSFEGSCRGFVLIVHYPTLVVWNPTTNVHRTLSCSSFTTNAINHNKTTFDVIDLWAGLGYDASTDDYLIVMGWHEKSVNHADFFSFRSNAWKKIDDVNENFPYKISPSGSKAGEFLNGALHWLAEKKETKTTVIVAFDMAAKDFTEIALPQNLDGYFYSLKVLGGRLGVCHGKPVEGRIWVMREYKVEASWTRIEDVVLPYATDKSAALCMTKDERIIASNDMGHLVKFSHRGRYAEHEPNDLNHHSLHRMIAYTETLFSLPGDVNEAV